MMQLASRGGPVTPRHSATPIADQDTWIGSLRESGVEDYVVVSVE